jgi:hypothetical protein
LTTMRPTTVERAYQLARSGECADLIEVRKRLKAEGYQDERFQLHGLSITSELRKLCEAARKGGGEAVMTQPKPRKLK